MLANLISKESFLAGISFEFSGKQEDKVNFERILKNSNVVVFNRRITLIETQIDYPKAYGLWMQAKLLNSFGKFQNEIKNH